MRRSTRSSCVAARRSLPTATVKTFVELRDPQRTHGRSMMSVRKMPAIYGASAYRHARSR
jgi:hypothetical protein